MNKPLFHRRISSWLFGASRDAAFVSIILLLSIGLALSLIPWTLSSTVVPARVLALEGNTEPLGLYLRSGNETIRARILWGQYRDQEITVDHALIGNLLLDREVSIGDRVLLRIVPGDDGIAKTELVDYDRQTWELLLFAGFAVLLLLVACSVGLRALISFLFTGVVLVRILLPAILHGFDPLWACVGLAALIAGVTLLLVAGMTYRALAAIIGVTLGMVVTAALTVLFGQRIRLDGIVSEHAVNLFFSGHSNLNLDRIFWGAIVLSASGALTDMAISVATAVSEVNKANPQLGLHRLIRSGFEVGRAALGTMITTLLLAYTGCSLFLLLVFAAEETHIERILNFNFVSAEILRTLAGNIGMVLVAPVTALVASILFHYLHPSVHAPGGHS